MWLKRSRLKCSYLLQNKRKWISFSMSPLLQIKQIRSSGSNLGLMNLPVSILRCSNPRRNFDKFFLCLKERGLKIWGESRVKFLSKLKILNLGNGAHNDFQFIWSFLKRDPSGNWTRFSERIFFLYRSQLVHFSEGYPSSQKTKYL